MDIIQDITKIMINFITTPMAIMQSFPPTEPPFSSIFILIISFLVSLASTLVSRKMIDVEKLRRLTRETREYNKLRMQMLKTADNKLKLKYERNADRMRKVQSELTMMNMKPLLIMFLPLILFFAIFSNFYSFSFDEVTHTVTGNPGIPAVIPFGLPEQLLFAIGKLAKVDGWGRVFVPNYIWWYFGGSIVFGSILRKVSGLQPD